MSTLLYRPPHSCGHVGPRPRANDDDEPTKRKSENPREFQLKVFSARPRTSLMTMASPTNIGDIHEGVPQPPYPVPYLTVKSSMKISMEEVIWLHITLRNLMMRFMGSRSDRLAEAIIISKLPCKQQQVFKFSLSFDSLRSF